MKLVPLNDLILVKAPPRAADGNFSFQSLAAGEVGEVVALGAICGRSEAQGVKVGSRVLFDRNAAKGAGVDAPDLYLICEDDLRALLVDDTDEN